MSAPLSNTESGLPSDLAFSSIGEAILQPKQQHTSSIVQVRLVGHLALTLRHTIRCSLPEFLASRRHRKHVQMVSNIAYSKMRPLTIQRRYTPTNNLLQSKNLASAILSTIFGIRIPNILGNSTRGYRKTGESDFL